MRPIVAPPYYKQLGAMSTTNLVCVPGNALRCNRTGAMMRNNPPCEGNGPAMDFKDRFKLPANEIAAY